MGAVHLIGTTCVAGESRQAIVGQDRAVRDLEGLSVVGDSMVPAAGHANPLLMIVAGTIRPGDVAAHG